MAAETKKLRQELLSVGPFCMIETGELNDEGRPRHTVHYCSPNSTRTMRSGVTDVKYMIRPDREFWFFCLHSNPTRARACTHACVRFIAPWPCAASSSLRGSGSPPRRATTSSCAAPT